MSWINPSEEEKELFKSKNEHSNMIHDLKYEAIKEKNPEALDKLADSEYSAVRI